MGLSFPVTSLSGVDRVIRSVQGVECNKEGIYWGMYRFFYSTQIVWYWCQGDSTNFSIVSKVV